MFRLTREVRFAVNAVPDGQLAGGKPTNSYAGFPSLTGLGHFFTLRVTLAGPLDPASSYLRNIKEVDAAVRGRAVGHVERQIREGRFGGGAGVAAGLFRLLRHAWPGARVDCLSLGLSPFLRYSVLASDQSDQSQDSPEPFMDSAPPAPVVRLSQKFEFSATHRLHNPALPEADNCRLFGKCNNPHGHGHNYEVQVTLAGRPDGNGLLVDVPAFERIVAATVIDRFDHKNLNVEVPEFRETIPTVENIAMTIFRLLKPRFADAGATLAAMTVWETPKTWCEYSE